MDDTLSLLAVVPLLMIAEENREVDGKDVR